MTDDAGDSMAKRTVIVTNFNKNFTGVSATAANVVNAQVGRYDLHLTGVALPNCPKPIPLKNARDISRSASAPVIWHVRRNTEMRAGLWGRDVLRLPIKLVFTSAAQRLHSAYPRWLISKMDAVIATTPEAASYVPNVRAVVPHGVNTQMFRPAQDRAHAWKMLGFGGTRGIATVGRIRPEKGTDLFVDTMIDVLPKHPDTTALIVGKVGKSHRAFAQSLQQKISAAGLQDRIIFTGELPPDRTAQIMQALSLLVALPRYEGYGMTPLEAMACGVPFVGSNTGYFTAFSDGERTGRVVPVEDLRQSAEAIDALLSDPLTLTSMGQAAHTFATTQHSAQREADGIDAVYRAVWAEAVR